MSLAKFTNASLYKMVGVLITLIVIIVFSQGRAVAVSNVAPDPNDNPGSGDSTMLVVSDADWVYNGLDAPVSEVVVYFKNPSGRLYVENGRDQCGKPPDSNSKANTSFQFFEGQTPGVDYIRTVHGDTFGCGTGYVNFSGLSGEQVGDETYYPVFVRARNNDTSSGGVNAFKLRASSSQDVISYYSQSGSKFAIQDRYSSNYSKSTFKLFFGADCTVDGSERKDLKWYDDDYGHLQTNNDFGAELYEKAPGGNWAKVLGKNDFNYTGNGGEGTRSYRFKENHKYEWRWSGVYKTNGIQFQLPYNSVFYNVECETPIEADIRCQTLTPNSIRVRYRYEDATETVRIRRNSTTIATLNSEDSGGWQTINDTGLSPGTSYTYRVRHDGATAASTSCRTQDPPLPNEHKIFGANDPEVGMQWVRDNRRFGIDLNTALWPDAAMRSSSRATNLWLAGVWGGPGDTARSDTSRNADPNYMTSFNYKAELGCPGGSCLERVPMAYVPQNDGLGIPGTSTKDGSTTPEGNNWVSIREESFGSQSGSNVSSCGSYNRRYNPKCGGIASRLGMSLNGRTGNWIEVVEISNIHVRGIGLNGSTTNGAIQGGIDGRVLQHDVRNTTNLPNGSQGPIDAAGNPFNAWDNIRSPGDPNGVFSLNINNPNASFEYQQGTASIAHDPYNMTGSYQSLTSQVGGGDVVAILQDGNDRHDPEDYPRKQEPLSYTWGVTSVDRVDLMWNEYARWNQVDDKGHWYTNQSYRPTGVDRGNPDTNDTTTLYRVDRGSREVDYVHEHTYCRDYDWVDTDGDGWVDSYQCVDEYTYDHYHYTSCTGSYPTRIGYRYNTKGYYRDSVQSRFGWYNTDTVFRNMPYGSDGSTRQSGFWYNYSSNPPWTNTGSTYYWQDMGITSMSNAGTSNNLAHSSRWQYNTTDPAYNNRHIFNRYTRPSFRTSWYRTSYRCTYPNGDADPYTANVRTHYPNARYLYENSTYAYGRVYGKYNFSYDGNKNGYVDYRWSWRNNYQRVRYENTYEDHYRKLGPRSASGTPLADNLLYGLRPRHANLNERRMKVSRDAGEIVSPSVAIGEADVFAAGGIDSYFENSFANSAFLFTNEEIRNFTVQNDYPQYWINPDDDRVRSSGDYETNYPNYTNIDHGPNDNDPITTVLQDELDKLYDNHQAVDNSDFGATFNLGQNSGRSYLYDGGGELEVGNTTFCDGAGTIIVEGDLVINGDINYCNTGSNNIEDIPVVGFLVFGDIDIRPNVRNVHGAYFTTGTIHTGSVLLDQNGNGENPDDNRTEADRPLNIRGLMIAHRFILARQLSGADNRNLETESFEYDGRIVLNPPPGFDYVYRFPAAWNEAAPREE